MRKFLKIAICGAVLLAGTLIEAEAQSRSATSGQKYFTSVQNKKTPTITAPATPHMSANGDTITTGTEYQTLSAATLKNLSVHLYATKGTGTRLGKTVLECSNDGNTWQRVKNVYGIASDSLAFVDAAGTAVGFVRITNFTERFLRAATTVTGTQSTYIKALATYKD